MKEISELYHERLIFPHWTTSMAQTNNKVTSDQPPKDCISKTEITRWRGADIVEGTHIPSHLWNAVLHFWSAPFTL